MGKVDIIDQDNKLYLYREDNGGDTFAAKSLEQAKQLFKEMTGLDPEEDMDWKSLPDELPITVHNEGVKEVKTAGEWAATMTEAGPIFGQE